MGGAERKQLGVRDSAQLTASFDSGMHQDLCAGRCVSTSTSSGIGSLGVKSRTPPVPFHGTPYLGLRPCGYDSLRGVYPAVDVRTPSSYSVSTLGALAMLARVLCCLRAPVILHLPIPAGERSRKPFGVHEEAKTARIWGFQCLAKANVFPQAVGIPNWFSGITIISATFEPTPLTVSYFRRHRHSLAVA